MLPEMLNHVQEDLSRIQNTLRENDFPENCIEKNMVVKNATLNETIREKASIFLKLQFKGNTEGELPHQRIQKSSKNTFSKAKLEYRFSSSPFV